MKSWIGQILAQITGLVIFMQLEYLDLVVEPGLYSTN
jgi:hypothetical protein